jgi:hypothetical protein
MLDGLKSGVFISAAAEADWLMVLVRDSAAHIQTCVTEKGGDAVELVQRLMLDPAAAHAISKWEPGLLEQISVTWTWLAAIAAARLLLQLHPDSEGLYLTPGGQLAFPCNIRSAKDGLIWAETFAATAPRDSRMLDRNLAKIAGRPECHRYGFFMSPLFPGNRRRPEFEQSGVQVWSVGL